MIDFHLSLVFHRVFQVFHFSNEFHWATDFIVFTRCPPLLWLVLLTPHLDGAVLQYICSFTVEPYADEIAYVSVEKLSQ